VSIRRALPPAILLMLIAVVLIQLPRAIAERTSDYEWFDPILEVRRILVRQYVTPPDEAAMHRASIEGMIRSLEDPYTQFIPPADTAEFNKQLRGTYAGIGAEVTQRDGYLAIVSPMDDSPALEAGILAGDLIIEIGGESTFRKSIEQCIAMLTGEPGTPVTIRVRSLDGSERDVTLTRRHIITRTVRGLWRVGQNWVWCLDESLGIQYVRLTQFNAASVQELSRAIDQAMRRNGLNGLVLDLRDNPGGALPVAVGIADLFLRSGEIVRVTPRVGREETYSATSEGTLPDFPMIVLINSGSASASEIVAGALQENGRAKVLGTRTFGKGSVQEVRPLEYGNGVLKYTNAYYSLASGRVIHRKADALVWGVDPDPGFVVPVDDASYRRMFRARRDFEIIRGDGESAEGVNGPCATVEWVRTTLSDEQLARAAEIMAARLRGEPWPADDEVDPGTLAFQQELARAMTNRMQLLEQLEFIEQRMLELQGHAGDAQTGLLPEDVDLQEGQIIVRDRLGNVIGRFRIEDGDVNLALRALDLLPLSPDDSEE